VADSLASPDAFTGGKPMEVLGVIGVGMAI